MHLPPKPVFSSTIMRTQLLEGTACCVASRASLHARTRARAYLSALSGSLIFISKNFFNKKVARSRPPPAPSSVPRVYSGGVLGTGRYTSYIRGEVADHSYTGLRRIKSFARCSRYFITFLYFEKRAVGCPPTSRNRMSTPPSLIEQSLSLSLHYTN